MRAKRSIGVLGVWSCVAGLACGDDGRGAAGEGATGTTAATATATGTTAPTSSAGASEGGSTQNSGSVSNSASEASNSGVTEAATGTSTGADTGTSGSTGGGIGFCGDDPPKGFVGPFNADCKTEPNIGTFTPVVEWTKQTFAVAPGYNQVMMAPVVAAITDDDADGVYGSEGDLPSVL